MGMSHTATITPTLPATITVTDGQVDARASVTVDGDVYRLDLSAQHVGPTETGLTATDKIISYIESMEHLYVRYQVDARMGTIADEQSAATLDMIVEMLTDGVEKGYVQWLCGVSL